MNDEDDRTPTLPSTADVEDYEQDLINRYAEQIDDWVITGLADARESYNGKGPHLTLLLNGTTVCGRVCSAQEWAQANWDKGRPEADRGSTDADGSYFSTLTQRLAESAAEYTNAWTVEGEDVTKEVLRRRWADPPRFIYLLDAYTLTDLGAKIPTAGTPMKVRISAINAWATGSLSSDNQPV